jgi:hypothetical protein
MNASPGDVEAVARGICARQYAEHFPSAPATDAAIDRHWHVVAALLEAGLIDESGTLTEPFDLEREVAAYRDWRARHPDYAVPSAGPGV